MINPEGLSLFPPTDNATNCFPPDMYVHAVALAIPGSSVCQRSFPVFLSKALNFLSFVPLIKTRPPAVTIGPAEPSCPVSAAFFSWRFSSFPNGICHSYSPVERLTAFSVPQGGRNAGFPSGSRDHGNGRKRSG